MLESAHPTPIHQGALSSARAAARALGGWLTGVLLVLSPSWLLELPPKAASGHPPAPHPANRREQEAFKDGGEEEQETALSSPRDPYT